MCEVKIIQCPDCKTNLIPDDIFLYKYYSLEAFLYLFHFKRILFRPIMEWPDSYEGLMFDLLSHARRGEEQKISSAHALGCCWSLQTEDARLYDYKKHLDQANTELSKRGSAAMWGNYCRNGGARIAVRLNRLIDLFAAALPQGTLYHGKVFYSPENNWNYAASQKDLACTFFAKRIAFRHESEYRFIFAPTQLANKPKPIDVSFNDFYSLIDEVLVAPEPTGQRWKARTLYNTLVTSVARPDRGTNKKENRTYCRISQLYGTVSEEIGHYGMD